MDKLEAITTLLGQRELEALTFLVEKAQACGSQHLAWNDKGERILKMSGCEIEFDRQEFLGRHPTIEALASLQFLSFRKTGDSRIEENYHLTLYPAAIYRVEHEKRNSPGKKWELWKLRNRDRMTLIAFWTSLVLAAIKVFEFLTGP